MDSNQLSGFDPRVQQQLSNLSQTRRGRRGSISSQSTASQSSYYSTHSTQFQQRGSRSSRGSQDSNQFSAQAPPGIEFFPPLGSQQPSRASNMVPQPYSWSQDQFTLGDGQTHRSQSAAQEFFARSRGRGRGRGPRRGEYPRTSNDPNAYSRPPPTQQQPYNPSAHQHYVNSDQREANRQRHMTQSDYLNAVVARSSANMLSTQEINQKQAFAVKIETFAKGVVSLHFSADESSLLQVKLQPYGSLANSFGTAGCDMDLLLTVNAKDSPYAEISEEIKRDLEKVLLNNGIGARLLTNTRIPILRVCETPDPDLLRNLRDHRSRWEIAAEESATLAIIKPDSAPLPHLSKTQEEQQLRAAQSLDEFAAEVDLPLSPPPNHAKLEYLGDCGIQCDVNFANHVALYNSRLLWTYGQCDTRVRHVGIFVKNWAKARDINTPYRGTLSSYGYILMVLHYLINVVHPPFLPNLQEMAKSDGWDQTPVELFAGHDVRFSRDLHMIKTRMASMAPNRSTAGALLLGFFRYYGQGQAGFRWAEQVISIRTPGGILTKQDKDWTRAKWSEENTNANVRQRYLLAIEDPFEIDHNVARTVGHHGVVAIRDEFRRAWKMIENVRTVQTLQGPIWATFEPETNGEIDAMDLLSPADSRGDLLRKDADSRKQQNADKARKLREELELKETMAKKVTLEDDTASQVGNNDHGMWQEIGLQHEDDSTEARETALLIRNFQHQDSKISRMRSRKPERERLNDMSDDDGSYEDMNDTSHDNTVLRDEEATYHTDDYEEASHTFTHNDDKWDNEEGQTPQNHATSTSWGEELPIENKNESTGVSPVAANPNRWDSEHERGSKNRGLSYDSDVVGQYIDWTQNSKGGRWLLKRDSLVRSGNWIPPTGNEFARLNTAFPYDPRMPTTRLAMLNAKLEALYKHTIYPAFTPEHEQEMAESSNVAIDLDESNKVTNGSSKISTSTNSVPGVPASSDDWAVGEDIPWTAETDIGSWLLWRDRRLRAGAEFKAPGWAGIGDKLCDLYPYDPRETMANIDRMNAELQTYFSDSTFPKKDMSKRDQYQCTEGILNAIEQVVAHRGIKSSNTTDHFNSIYSARFGAAVDLASPRSAVESSREQIMIDIPASDCSWTFSNSAGQWLRRRDALVVEGAWREPRSENSFYTHLNRIFPYEAHVNPRLRARQNQELDVNFNQIRIPSKDGQYGEPAMRALLQIVEGRQDDSEADRVRLLINLFKKQNPVDARSHQLSTGAEDSERSQISKKNDERAIEAIAVQLTKQTIPPSAQVETLPEKPSDLDIPKSDLAELRRQRLVYFAKLERTSDEGKQAKPLSPNMPNLQRRDSGAEGSWNDPSSSSKCREQPSDVGTNQVERDTAECDGPARTSTPEPHRDDWSNQSDSFVHTISTGPQNLFEPDQFAGSHIIPIVDAPDFEMDPAQLKDIKNIQAGGNGCVRGHSPFMTESDNFSWGGAGAMAHRSESIKESWDKSEYEIPHDEETAKQLDKELPTCVEW